MEKEDHCIFCKIVKKETKSWVIWESEAHLAFLSIYPNMKGVTVVIPKDHKPSYAFNLENKDLSELIISAKTVSKILDEKLEGVGRTALVLEGFGVDHVHAKLYPLPKTSHLVDKWQPVESDHKVYFDSYPGYVSSNDYFKAKDDELEALYLKLKEK